MPVIKLTEKIKEEVISLYETGNHTFTSISKLYNVNPSTIDRFLKKKGYKARGQPELQRKYPIIENFFDTIDTEEKAYFLGFLFADGYNRTERGYIYLALKEDDKQILEDLNNLIYKNKELRYLDIGKYNTGYENSTNQYRLEIYSKHISRELNDLGCTNNKTEYLIFPNIDKNLYSHFIRGYFDGDGSVSNGKTPRIDILGNMTFLEKIQDIIEEELGFSKTKLNKRHKNKETQVRSLQISGKKQCSTFGKWIYEDANIYMKRKYDIFLNKYNL